MYCKTALHTCCKPITEGNLAPWGVENRYLFRVLLSFHPTGLWYIPPACGTLYTPLMVTIREKTVMPIF